MAFKSFLHGTKDIVITVNSLSEFGCPYCGGDSGSQLATGHGSTIWVCNCGKSFHTVAFDSMPSCYNGCYPQPHPRQEIAARAA